MSERDPSVQVFTPRARGRPRVVGNGGFAISAWVSDADAQEIFALAKARRCSVSELLRDMMRARTKQLNVR